MLFGQKTGKQCYFEHLPMTHVYVATQQDIDVQIITMHHYCKNRIPVYEEKRAVLFIYMYIGLTDYYVQGEISQCCSVYLPYLKDAFLSWS